LLEPKSDLGFPEFYFEIHFESGEVPMDKVIYLIKSFKTIFYFEIFDFGKTDVDSNQVGTDLNYFKLQPGPVAIVSPSLLQLEPTLWAGPLASPPALFPYLPRV
jgi:hypothetical protein